LKEYLAKYDPAIADAEVAYGNRVGDIPHSFWLVSLKQKFGL
jgi:UDP-N-acetylglucosamine 4-epimerase